MTDEERNEFMCYLNDQYDLLIRKIALEVLQNDFLVDDVKQRVLIKLIPKAHILAKVEPKHAVSYIATVTRNVSITVYNQNATYHNYMEKYATDSAKTMTMDYVDHYNLDETYGFSDELWKLIQELPKQDQEILVYRFHYQMTSGEIAEVIGTNREHVKKRFQRSRNKLVKLIKERGLEF